MSGFLGSNQFGEMGTLLSPPSDRLNRLEYQWSFASPRQLSEPWAEGNLWSRCCNGLGLQFGFVGPGGDAGNDPGRWEPYDGVGTWEGHGNAKQKVIVGTTRDSGGNPLANCVVQGFVTATETFVGQVTSDNAGYFRLPTPNAFLVTHYLVAYKAGSPDIAGTTVNTLTPTD